MITAKVRDAQKRAVTKHGFSHLREYFIWVGMRHRCYNQKCKMYKYYGGRGIGICDRWRESPETFIDDMGLRPTKQHQLERIDNNLGYSPSNCRWATREEQSNNRCSNIQITYLGRTQTATEWARELGILPRNVLQRIRKYGMSPDLALSAPNLKKLSGAAGRRRRVQMEAWHELRTQ